MQLVSDLFICLLESPKKINLKGKLKDYIQKILQYFLYLTSDLVNTNTLHKILWILMIESVPKIILK